MAGPNTRLFGWDLPYLALYPYSPFVQSNSSPLMDLIGAWTDCKVSWHVEQEKRRATWEYYGFTIPVDIEYTVSLGARVDSTLPSLLQIVYTYGVGPHRIKFGLYEQNALHTYWGYVNIGDGSITMGDDAMAQSQDLIGQGFLTRF